MPNSLAVYKIFGGKAYGYPVIHKLLDKYPHEVFLDGFWGAGHITLNKDRSPKEMACEINWNLANLHYVIRDNLDNFIKEMDQIEYCRSTFDWSKLEDDGDSDLICAVKYLCRNRMSFSGLGEHYSWSERKRGGLPENLNSFRNTLKKLPKVSQRLQSVQLMCANTMDILEWNDGILDNPKCLCYLDPPYFSETRVTKDVYDNEMSESDHIRLLKLIQKAKCGVVISGYASDLYEKYLDGWVRQEYNAKVNMSRRKDHKMNDRVEVLWSNF